MLLTWAKAKGCKWVRDTSLTNLVLNNLKDKTKLSSPLKIRDYAISTVATTSEKELVDLIDEKSKETAKTFCKGDQ